MGSILGIVAACVEEVADIVGLQNLEDTVHIGGRAFRLLFEIEFVAAGAEGSGRSIFKALDRFGLLLVEIDQVFSEDAIDAVETPIDFLDKNVLAGFLNDPGDTGVDDRGRAARLRD